MGEIVIVKENIIVKEEKIESDEDLINAVRECPELYDHGNSQFKNNVRKTSIWNSIAKRTGITDPATRWRSIRDHYKKSLPKKISGDEAAPPESNYIYAPSLSFLLPHFQDRPSASSSLSSTSTVRNRKQSGYGKKAPSAKEIEEIENEMEKFAQEYDDDYVDVNEEDDQKNLPKKQKNAMGSSSATPKRKRSTCDSPLNPVDAAFIKVIESNSKRDDEDESYCTSLAAFMGKLSNKKKAEFRLEIEKLKMNFISEE